MKTISEVIKSIDTDEEDTSALFYSLPELIYEAINYVSKNKDS